MLFPTAVIVQQSKQLIGCHLVYILFYMSPAAEVCPAPKISTQGTHHDCVTGAFDKSCRIH